MRTVGIDLAAETRDTAVCVIQWQPFDVHLEERNVADDELIDVIAEADKTTIDAPLGWPTDFVQAIRAHHEGRPFDGWTQASQQRRRNLRLRATDRYLKEEFDINPLSVSTSWLGSVALRAAWIQARCGEQEIPVDRSGLTGKIAEAYPGAALRQAGLNTGRGSYKGKEPAAKDRRSKIVEQLQATILPDLADAIVARCIADDDDLDAVICAVIARAVLSGQTFIPSDDLLQPAQAEGWIHLPKPGLIDLRFDPT